MVIVTQYEERFNERLEVFFIVIKEPVDKNAPICPACSGRFSVRDNRRRHVIQQDGSRKTYLLRRLRCKECRRIHTELPSCIQPWKHYSVATVERVLDGRREDCPAENSTQRRWRDSFKRLEIQIEGALKSAWERTFRKVYPLLSQKLTLLDQLMSGGSGWLVLVNQLLIHSGIG